MKYPVYLFVIMGFLAGKTWLDLWQPDAFGHSDTAENCLPGYQYTDNHVKVQPECGEVVTSQLYFPNQPVDGLTVTPEERGDLLGGYLNLVLLK
jgi:hypothetical protein